MPQTTPRPNRSASGILRLIARGIVGAGIIVYTLIDETLTPLLRPLIAFLSSLNLFRTIGDWIAHLPPYAVLVLLAVPFVTVEPIKVVALVWILEGHLITGPLLLLGAYVTSILTCDRIYHAGHGKLMQIGWFNRLMTWLFGLRDLGLAWVRSTPTWIATARTIKTVRLRLRAWFRMIRRSN